MHNYLLLQYVFCNSLLSLAVHSTTIELSPILHERTVFDT